MMTRLTTFGLAAATAFAGLLATPNVANAERMMVWEADRTDLAPTRTRNGVKYLRPTDQEGTNEMASYAINEAGTKGIAIMMSSALVLAPGVQRPEPNDRDANVQGVCMPFDIALAPASAVGVAITPRAADFKFITDREGDEGRNFNIPEADPIFTNTAGVTYYAVTANFDRNNNTNTDRYVQVVDDQCNLMTLTSSGTDTNRIENNTAVRIMHKNNDNCSGGQAGVRGDQLRVAPNRVRFLNSALCNGNGRDDGWLNDWEVECSEEGACNVVKNGDTSYITREERSRGACDVIEGENMVVCCGTEGNNQPQREGVWCQGMDLTDTDDVLWKTQVAYRGETPEGQRTYAMRIKSDQIRSIDGIATGQMALQYQMHRGNNNGNKKGGYDDKVCLSTATPDRLGLNEGPCQDITGAVINEGVEFTHATMFHTYVGTPDAAVPTFTYLSPNHRANSNFNAKILSLPLTMGGQGAAVAGAEITGGEIGSPVDGNLYSKYLGNNPNNQGRNYMKCSHETIQGKHMNLCILNGKVSSTNLEPEVKPDLYFEAWPSVVEPPASTPEEPEEPGTPGTPGTPETPEEGEPGTTTPGNDIGGCSTTGGMGGGFAFLLIGLAFLGLRRRRN